MSWWGSLEVKQLHFVFTLFGASCRVYFYNWNAWNGLIVRRGTSLGSEQLILFFPHGQGLPCLTHCVEKPVMLPSLSKSVTGQFLSEASGRSRFLRHNHFRQQVFKASQVASQVHFSTLNCKGRKGRMNYERYERQDNMLSEPCKGKPVVSQQPASTGCCWHTLLQDLKWTLAPNKQNHAYPLLAE